MMSLHLMGHVGHDLVAEYAEIMHLNPRLVPEFAAALGTQETTVLRMATAYSTIANGGILCGPVLLILLQIALVRFYLMERKKIV